MVREIRRQSEIQHGMLYVDTLVAQEKRREDKHMVK